ncbi:MAG: hypothetical protein ACXAEN_21610 [Candidatus Thorarchaeota archaeon]|jgi:hypothetical protein
MARLTQYAIENALVRHQRRIEELEDAVIAIVAVMGCNKSASSSEFMRLHRIVSEIRLGREKKT